jgi:hypothetical protein
MTMLWRFALAALCILLMAAAPAHAAPPPSFTIYPAAAQEDSGQLCFPVKMHGTRSTSLSTVKVTIVAGTATAGSDFVAGSVGLLFQPSEFGTTKPACFTLINDSHPEPSETVTGQLTKGVNARLYVGSAPGTILDTDQAAPPQPAPAPDPAPAPEPAPAPSPGGWVVMPLADAPNARAVRDCSSIYRTAESDRVGIAFTGVRAGEVYSLLPGDSMGKAPSWGWTDARNVDGQKGHVWVVGLAAGGHATVAESCLEGGRPAP